MWISKDKYDALVARLDAIDARAKENATLTVATGKITRQHIPGYGPYEAPEYASISVKDALSQVMKATGLCVDHKPKQPEIPESTVIKKCDKKGK